MNHACKKTKKIEQEDKIGGGGTLYIDSMPMMWLIYKVWLLYIAGLTNQSSVLNDSLAYPA